MTNPGAPALASVPTSENADRLPASRACLEAMRMRSRMASMLRGAIFSLVAALALLCGLEILALYSDIAAPAASLAAPSGQPFSYIAWSVAAFACAFALATVLAFLRTPDIAMLARKADRALALQERLSTALEVDAISPSQAALGPVRAALLADAERHAAAIDPRQIVRLDLPRAVWAVPGLIVMAALLQLVSPDAFGLAVSHGPVAGTERDGVSFSGPQAAEAAANLRRVAELLGKDAQERSDPYLRTIARALERLSADAERPGVDRRVLAGALDRLLAHTRQAYGQANNAKGGSVPRDVVQQLQAALDDIAGNRQTGTATPREPDAGARDVAAAKEGQAGRSAQSPERKTASVGTPPETATPGRQPSRDDLLKDLDDYDPVDPRIEKERAFADQQRRARAASQSVGAARDAGQGEGDRAGDGTRPLGNAGAAASTELAPGVEMLLPDQAAANGGRIRIELPPEVMRSDVAPPAAGSGGEWQRAREGAIARAVPGAEDRKVLGRYFARSAGGRGP
jgi:hypothetical protein